MCSKLIQLESMGEIISLEKIKFLAHRSDIIQGNKIENRITEFPLNDI